MKTIIYHNPRCSKSREALNLLNERGEDVEVVEYLKNPPDRATLIALIRKLGITPIQLVRTGEEAFKPYKGKQLSDDEVINIMVANPTLIERPVVLKGNKAVIGRPPHLIINIL